MLCEMYLRDTVYTFLYTYTRIYGFIIMYGEQYYNMHSLVALYVNLFKSPYRKFHL